VGARHRLKILVVDEDGDVRAYIAATLGRDSEVAHVREAGHALQWLAQHDARRLDLVIIDAEPAAPQPLSTHALELLQALVTRWPWLSVVVTTPAAGRLVIKALYFGRRRPLRPSVEAAKLTALLERIQRPRTRRRDSATAMKPVLAFIGEHYTEPIPLRDLAEMAAMSRFHFCRVFQAVAGRSLRDYVRELRLTRARELLSTSTLSMTDIALETGFYDLPHLDKAFRKRFGAAPSAFARPRPIVETRRMEEPRLPGRRPA
jgi:AraC-like DNA-binding protein